MVTANDATSCYDPGVSGKYVVPGITMQGEEKRMSVSGHGEQRMRSQRLEVAIHPLDTVSASKAHCGNNLQGTRFVRWAQ